MMNNKQQNVEAYSAVGAGASTKGRVFGGACAGVLELALFHPVDTIAKRLMANTKNAAGGGGISASIANANQVVFKEAANAGLLTKVKSLFPGVGFAGGYKILQRSYKFGLQPVVKDYINQKYGKGLQSTFGEKKGKVLSSAVAGSIMGVGEVVLLPLDALKIRAQTNPDVLKGRGLVDLLKEGPALYRGAGTTALRNAPGSFALFGGSAVAHYGIFGLEKTSDATFFQNFVASILGATASITVAAPLDVVKTRIQNKPFDAPESGMQIIRNIIRHEGPGAFFKGLTPKLLVVGPKLIFSFTVAQSAIQYFEKRFN